MRRLEQQIAEILKVMYDSVTNQNFDRVSDDVDSISGAVDNNSDKIDTDNIQMPYDYDNDNATGQMKGEQNMTNELTDVDTNDMVPYERNEVPVFFGINRTTSKWTQNNPADVRNKSHGTDQAWLPRQFHGKMLKFKFFLAFCHRSKCLTIYEKSFKHFSSLTYIASM